MASTRSAEARLALALVVFVGSGCGAGGDEGLSRSAVVTRVASKVAPRWEQVADFSGRGVDRTGPFEIARHAVQWRVTVTCEEGHTVKVRITGEADALVDGACAPRTFGFSIRPGEASLDVDTTGEWNLVIDQQVETTIDEAPLAGMSARSTIAGGDFFAIDQKASGSATLYRLADGRLALRLDPFRVTANSDLFVWVSEATKPRTSEAAFRSTHVQIAALKATAGPQNYVLPEGLALPDIRSVIVWCEPVRTAYGAASLEPT